jgi:iduronate 2-sulfatase
LIDLCNLKGDTRKNNNGGNLGGYSLKPFLNNPETTEWEGPNGALTMIGVGLDKEDAMKQTYSYRTNDWRYILYMDGSEELYQNIIDPFEWNNLAKKNEYAEKKKELKKEMLQIIKSN